MTPAEKARFDARSNILRDPRLSHGAIRLFLLMDDEVKGEPRFAIKRQRMAVGMGLSASPGRISEMLAELVKAGYLQIKHLMTGNTYQFSWFASVAKTEHSSVAKTDQREATNGNTVPIDKNLQEPSPTPQAGNAGAKNSMKPSRQNGTNPRSLGTNPRAAGTNPLARAVPPPMETQMIGGVCVGCANQGFTASGGLCMCVRGVEQRRYLAAKQGRRRYA